MMQGTAVLDTVKHFAMQWIPSSLNMSTHYLLSEFQTDFFTFLADDITSYQKFKSSLSQSSVQLPKALFIGASIVTFDADWLLRSVKTEKKKSAANYFDHFIFLVSIHHTSKISKSNLVRSVFVLLEAVKL